MSNDEIDNANSEQPLGDAPHYVWQYYAIMNHTNAKKGRAKMHFVTKISVDAARSEQQHIS